ncbi:Surface antigen-like protein [Lotmaria passim]
MVVGSNGFCMIAGSCFVTKCAQCVSNNNWECQTCLTGYALTAVGGCVRRRGNGAAGVASLATAAAVCASAMLPNL